MNGKAVNTGMKQKLIHGGDIYSDPKLLDFSANINPLGMTERIYHALEESMKRGTWGHYPDPLCRELCKAIAEREGVCADEVLCGCGAADLIFRLTLAVKPKKALLPVPTFAEYQLALDAVNCKTKLHFLLEKDEFRLGEHFLEQLTQEIEMVFLCHPNNPTGWTVHRELMEKIIERCCRQNILLVVDECFLEFTQAESVIPLRKDSPNLIVLRAFTKTYAMAGLRIGYAISADSDLLQRMRQAGQPWSVSVPAQAAGIAACREQDFLEQSLSYLAIQKQILKTELFQMGFTVIGSEANYLFFHSPIPKLSERLKEYSILIRDCSNYIGLQKGYYRIAVRTAEENQKLLEALKQIWGDVHWQRRL